MDATKYIISLALQSIKIGCKVEALVNHEAEAFENHKAEARLLEIP